ncbi:hypothetical protein M569_03198 [Genlisea aurea]|uniref:Uncharacterized protein n=1 Tax=Genlisea aurea TaxID=192259 RepID=S8EFY2_9LAMI|nr:hypothetical protein M569_03198 [Genlisea aurea]
MASSSSSDFLIPETPPKIQKKSSTKSACKLLLLLLILFAIPLFPLHSQTREIIHLLFVGIAVPYGILGTKTAARTPRNESSIAPRLSGILRLLSSVFEDEILLIESTVGGDLPPLDLPIRRLSATARHEDKAPPRSLLPWRLHRSTDSSPSPSPSFRSSSAEPRRAVRSVRTTKNNISSDEDRKAEVVMVVYSDAEVDRKAGEFIAKFRRQIKSHGGTNSARW